jgi:methylthioribose-1-phosphate isomerase
MTEAVIEAIRWDDGDIVIVDQTLLPAQEEYLRLSTTQAIAEAIVALRVRGAPALGIVGGMGVAQAALRGGPDAAERAAAVLRATRPTAVNLGWAIDRVLGVVRASGDAARVVADALAIQREDAAACLAMAEHAQIFFTPGSTVMTHCNTGMLVTGGIGTALGAIRLAHERGLGVAVLATETRPLLQGARLTAWELGRLGIPHHVVVDGAGPGLLARGEASMVIVGADRIAANGDVANKVGTYALALAARAAGVPFVVVAPTSTIDARTTDGAAIEVEERARDEVAAVGSVVIAPPDSPVRNPAFDITPADLVTAIVTEWGVSRPPYDFG